MSTFNKRRVVGRKIVAVRMNSFDDGGFHSVTRANRTTYDPVFVLDNGAELSFMVHETEVGEYGIDPVLRPAPKKGQTRGEPNEHSAGHKTGAPNPLP